jgi:hypothetical protein
VYAVDAWTGHKPWAFSVVVASGDQRGDVHRLVRERVRVRPPREPRQPGSAMSV